MFITRLLAVYPAHKLGPAVAKAMAELLLARFHLGRLKPEQIRLRNDRAQAASGSIFVDATGHKAKLDLVAYVIPRVASRVPWRADCLVQAMAAQRWLTAERITSTISIGVKRSDQGEFVAHAWLKHGETVVTGGEIGDYSPLLESADLGSAPESPNGS